MRRRSDPCMHPLLEEVERNILENRLLTRGQTLLVAASGGRDSMVLLRMLHELSPLHEWKLVAGHLNHRLRGAESDADQRLVARECAALEIPAVLESADVMDFARLHRVSMEMAARSVRHRFLARAARAAGAEVVLLGHHGDDQVELFFLRLLRGAGGAGLAGMSWVGISPADRAVRLVRPLLGQTRASISRYARDRGVRFRTDRSNAELEPARNRIRRLLLPLLRREYQRGLSAVVVRSMEMVGADADYVAGVAESWLKAERRGRFELLHVAVQREAIRRQLWRLGMEADFGLVERLRREPGRVVSVAHGLRVRRDAAGLIRGMGEFPVLFREEERALVLAGKSGHCHFGGLQVNWRLGRERGVVGRGSFRDGVEWFDADKVGSHVTLRHWRRGDRFQPIGMGVGVKLQDLFVNARIGRERRHKLVVATTRTGRVFWVEGLRIGEGFKLDKASMGRLKWSWHRGETARERLVAPFKRA
jgi:tRNA(Ile)-lysidine synthase